MSGSKKTVRVILRSDVQNLGQRGEVREVLVGYARNFLLPRGLAVFTESAEGMKLAANQEAERTRRAKAESQVRETLRSLKNVQVVVSARANDKGHLFQAIQPSLVSALLKSQHHIEFPAERIEFAEQIKTLGEYSAIGRVGDKQESFTVLVQREEDA